MTNDVEEQRDEAEAPPVVDTFATFEKLLALLADPRRHAAEMDVLKQRLTAVAAAERALAAERTRLDEHEKATRARHAEEHHNLSKRRGAVYAENKVLDEMAAEQATLEKAWRRFGESDDVASGFREPLRSALEKARRAHGLPSSEPEPPPLPVRFVNPLLSVRPRGTARRSRA